MKTAAPLFTVCTPSYNRAGLLKRTYDSLRDQTFQDFEWLIVDDGSTDNTAEVVNGFISEGKLDIRYLPKKNGGKHTALNLAGREARGSLFTVIDSDDWFEKNALERMKSYWDQVPDSRQKQLKGICGLFAYEDGQIVGDRFPADILDCDDLDLDIRYSVEGDKIGFTRTEIMREFPFPEDLSGSVAGVVYIPESLVWHRMGQKYPTRFVNEVFAIKEYQRGGITHRGRVIQARNSKATLLYIYEILTCGRRLPARHALKGYSNYIRHSLHEKLSLMEQMKRIPSKLWFVSCIPIGLFLWTRDRYLFRQDEARA